MATNATPTDPKRRLFRPRFTLAALLIVVTVIAIPLAYVAQRRAWNLRRAKAREELSSLGFDLDWNEPLPWETAELTGVSRWWAKLLLEDENRVYQITNEFKQTKTPSDLSLFRFFPEVSSLVLEEGPEVTDETLSICRTLPNLDRVELRYMPKVTGDFLATLPHPDRLEHLSFSNLSSLESQELRCVGAMVQLKSLDIYRCPRVTDESFGNAGIASSLEELELWDCGVGDATLRKWLHQCKLKRLCILGRVSRAIAPDLATQTELTELHIANTPLVDEDFAFLANCTNLRDLEIAGSPIEGRFLKSLGAPEQISRLHFNSTLFSDANLDYLNSCEHLDHLDLSWTPIRGVGFTRPNSWTKLQYLGLCGTRFSEEGKRRLSKLNVSGANITLPINWTIEDEKHLCSNYSRDRTLSEIEVRKRPTQTGQPFDYGYSANEASLEDEPLDNFPRELMAPVLRLHELARAKAEK